MNCVYVLQSLVADIYYIGYSSDVKKRLAQHNSGQSQYTRQHMPWKLVYCEIYQNEKLARDREKQLKRHGQAWTALKKRAGL